MIVAVALTVMMVMIVVMTAGAVVAVLMVVMMVVAVGLAVMRQDTGQQLGDGDVRLAGAARVELDVGVIQRHLSAHADAAADQGVYAHLLEHTGERAVAGAIGVNDFLSGDLAILDGVELELSSVAEVLEDLTVFIRNSYFHIHTS